MELKNYQRKVIDDLTRYLDLMQETNDIVKAYNMFWREQNVPVGINGMQPYQNVIPNVPDLCLKVPTGGGKTFLACNAIAPIFDALPMLKMKTVVWLVPSEAILTQTLAALRNVNHPYRQAINLQFQHNVEVYTKDQLLSGQNFNITAVREQLSIMVLSYDSFRGRKELLKAKQENSALAPMAKALGAPDMPLEDTDETALMQIINQLNPLVIVDESHHARSKLSKKMLQDFNPSDDSSPLSGRSRQNGGQAIQISVGNVIFNAGYMYRHSFSSQHTVALALLFMIAYQRTNNAEGVVQKQHFSRCLQLIL